jgi:hypothetical protein
MPIPSSRTLSRTLPCDDLQRDFDTPGRRMFDGVRERLLGDAKDMILDAFGERERRAHIEVHLFAQAGTYPVILRLSSTPGDLLDDSVSTPRGLAIKVIGVAGERLPGSEGAVTQDFILINGPAFAAPDAKSFLKNSSCSRARRTRRPVSSPLWQPHCAAPRESSKHSAARAAR